MNRNIFFPSAFFLLFSITGCSSSAKAPDHQVSPDNVGTEVASKTTSLAPAGEKTVEAPAERAAGFQSEDKPAKPYDRSDRNNLMTCSSMDETRTLSVAAKEGGCELIYEKNDKLNVPAYSAHGTEHCFNSREKIRKRLESQGWKCSL